jgi:iron complex outermembrane receptor protein
VDGLRRASDDYGLPDSSDTQPNTFTDSYAIGGGGAWLGALGRVGLGYGRNVDDYGVSEPEEPGGGPTIQLESQHFDSQADWNVGRLGLDALRWRGRYTDYTHDEVVDGDAASTFEADTWEGRLEGLHDPLGPFEGGVGFHFLLRELSAEGEGSELLAPAATDLFAGYVFEDVWFSEALRLELGGRVERNFVDGRDRAGRARGRNFWPLSGSAGLVWSPTEQVSLGVTGSASQRAPDALELFAKGPHEADGTFQIGDPDADAETSYTAELNGSAHLTRVALHGAVFYSYYDGFVFGRLTGAQIDGLRELIYTQQTAHFAGFELSGEAPVWSFAGLGQVGLDSQVDWVRGWLSGGHNVPRLPPLRWGAGVYFAGERVRARFGFLRHERQWFQGENETETAGYTMLDASTSVRLLGDEDRGVSLDVGVDNLNDARARNHVSFKKEDQRLPGRSVRVGLRGTF